MDKINGIVFGVQRFSVHDGPGIRTTLFLKGCNLHCSWCHNPESILMRPQLSYNGKKCVNCRVCEKICPAGVHHFGKDGHTLTFDTCISCKRCTELCERNALEMIGYEMSAKEAAEKLLRDRKYYRNGGGVTFSGGEALLQLSFVRETAKQLKEEQVHIALETNGAHPFHRFEEILPYIDLFLYDYKVTDPRDFKKYVGEHQEQIKENLIRLHEKGKTIILRCPIIPGINDNRQHLEEIARITRELPGLLGAELLPYHPLGVSKALQIGKMQEEYPALERDRIEDWKKTVESAGGRSI